MATDVTTTAVDKMNSLLQGELSALETYRLALEKVEDSRAKDILMQCHMCHSRRVDAIVEKIVSLAGKPAENSGAWGSFAKLLEGGATVFGDKAAVSMLEEGEDRGLADYRKLATDPDLYVRELAADLLPKQEGTHERVRSLKLLLK